MSSHGSEVIVGIDLGTTNSEVAAFVDGRVQVLGPGRCVILPSCVGLSPGGELLIGEAARNQYIVYPERTVRSIKRKMGTDEKVVLGDREFSPPEISALILRELAGWAGRRLGVGIGKAVITVPAYFSDAQRNATREAGALAGLEVVRILNEPTAASLAYGSAPSGGRTVLVYDLGGGTFDVSIVSTECDVTEVLASHGNNHLGGDDFDGLIVEHLIGRFRDASAIDVSQGHPVALARLWMAAEEAKKRLSDEPFATVREESLVVVGGHPHHLEVELSRLAYEDMIRPLVESTLDSVTRALQDSGRKAGDLDAVLLVGGATRTPLISKVLEDRCGLAPRRDVDPELTVALGAGTLASRLAGREVDRVLVDVSPYSFGPSYLGEQDGYPYPHCYHPVILRNTPLPQTRTEGYITCRPHQTEVELTIYQGDDPDALKNVPVGRFRVEGLTPLVEPNDVLCKMHLDVDGILHVTAVEKRTGLAKSITIDDAVRTRSDREIEETRRRLEALHAGWLETGGAALDPQDPDVGGEVVELAEDMDDVDDVDDADDVGEAGPGEDGDQVETRRDAGEDARSAPITGSGGPEAAGPGPGDARTPGASSVAGSSRAGEAPGFLRAAEEAQRLLERSRGLLPRIHEDDRGEALELHQRIEISIARADLAALEAARAELAELLFFVSGSEAP